jgi:hypothetical protein
MQVEWEKEQLGVFEALKSGNKALEDIHKVLTRVDCFEQLDIGLLGYDRGDLGTHLLAKCGVCAVDHERRGGGEAHGGYTGRHRVRTGGPGLIMHQALP